VFTLCQNLTTIRKLDFQNGFQQVKKTKMSAATNYLQRFIEQQYAFETDPRFDPRATNLGGKMNLGVEITIVESNLAFAYWDAGGRFNATLSPGQKSYIRFSGCEITQTVGGFQYGPGGTLTTIMDRTGLSSTGRRGERWYAYNSASTNWIYDQPFRNDNITQLEAIEISLIPFQLNINSWSLGGLPPQPDDKVHVRVRRPDNEIILLADAEFDERTQQLYCYGATMETVDNPALWIISFFIHLNPPK